MNKCLSFLILGWTSAVWAEPRNLTVEPRTDLARVRDEIRLRRVQGEKGPVVVELKAGRYALARALELDGRDSDVTWRAAPGAEVRISGGCLISASWGAVTDPALLQRLPEKSREKVRQIDLAAYGVTDWGDYLFNYEDGVQRRVANTWNQNEFTQGSHPPAEGDGSVGRLELFVDDRPMTVARTPTNVVYHVDQLLGPKIRRGPGAGTEVCKEATFTVVEDFPRAWDLEPDAHLCGCWCRDWAEQHQRIAQYDRARKAVELSKPWHQYCYKSGAEFFGFNLLCELDEPGEWYLDRASGKLLAWLPEGATRIELSQSGRLFELTGATNVVFQGLTLEACRNSAVKMKDCTRSYLESCTVRNVGQHALIVEDGQACGARGCSFYGMGGGGAFLVDGNRETLESSGHFAENCDIHDFGRWNRMYRPGVCLSGVGMRAVGNKIHDAPHAAILFFGCELLMQSNEVYRVNQQTKDCGAFYSGRSWMLRGNRILDNFFHDIVGLRGAYTRTIYLDDSMADTVIAGNRFERCTWAIFIGGSRENVIANNVFVDCPNALYMDARGLGWQRPHINGRLEEMEKKGTLYGLRFKDGPYADKYPIVKTYPPADPYRPVQNVIKDNVFDRGEGVWIRQYGRRGIQNSPDWWYDNMPPDEFARLGTFRNNVVDGKKINEGRWYVGPDDGGFSQIENWEDGQLPGPGETVAIPEGRTVVVSRADWARFRKLAAVRLLGPQARLELRDATDEFGMESPVLLGRGQLRVVSTEKKPGRFELRRDLSDFAGSFFFTNVAVSVHGPQTLGRSCPVTFCKVGAGSECQFNFARGGVYTSDLTFLPPQGSMWYAVGARGAAGESIVNRGRIEIPEMPNKHCGRIHSLIPFIQEGRLDLGSRIDLSDPVSLACPIRHWGAGEILFSDTARGRIAVRDGFTLGAGLTMVESIVKLVEGSGLGPWKQLVATSSDPSLGASLLKALSPEWASHCEIRSEGREVVLTWFDRTAPSAL